VTLLALGLAPAAMTLGPDTIHRGRTAPVFDHLMHWVPDLPAAVTAYQDARFPAADESAPA
jgi:hypothetical protein